MEGTIGGTAKTGEPEGGDGDQGSGKRCSETWEERDEGLGPSEAPVGDSGLDIVDEGLLLWRLLSI